MNELRTMKVLRKLDFNVKERVEMVESMLWIDEELIEE